MRAPRLEIRRQKNVAETLDGEVGGDEAQVLRRRRCRGGEALAFVSLRRRVVDLENDEVFGVEVFGEGEGIETRADDHILPYAPPERALKGVFAEACAAITMA